MIVKSASANVAQKNRRAKLPRMTRPQRHRFMDAHLPRGRETLSTSRHCDHLSERSQMYSANFGGWAGGGPPSANRRSSLSLANACVRMHQRTGELGAK